MVCDLLNHHRLCGPFCLSVSRVFLRLQRQIYGVFTPEQDNGKANVEPVHFCDAFHTRFVGPGVKGIIEMHRFNICLVVVLSLSCSGVKTPLHLFIVL